MSSIGPADTSIIQAAQAQQSASKSRDRERAVTDRGQRLKDLVDLKVAGTEASDAIRKLPRNDSEQAEDEHHRQNLPERPHIDFTA